MPSQYLSIDVGIKNLALCVASEQDGRIGIVAWRNVDLTDGAGVKHTSNEAILERLIDVLDEVTHDCMADIDACDTKVLVENQPSRARKIMTSLQCFVHAYFLMQRKYRSAHALSVHVVTPKGKLRTAAHMAGENPAGGTVGGRGKKGARAKRGARYRENKKATIHAVADAVRHDALPVTFDTDEARHVAALFQDHSPTNRGAAKLDDLADAFLQLMFFLKM